MGLVVEFAEQNPNQHAAAEKVGGHTLTYPNLLSFCCLYKVMTMNDCSFIQGLLGKERVLRLLFSHVYSQPTANAS